MRTENLCFYHFSKKKLSKLWPKNEDVGSMATGRSQTRMNVIFVTHGGQDINMQSFKKIREMPFPGQFDAYRE